MDILAFIGFTTLVFIAVIIIKVPFLPMRNEPLQSKPIHISDYRYDPIKSIVTDTELSFYRALSVVVKGRHVIFAKVRIADLITPKKGLYTKKVWWRAFNKISRKHIDFVLCDPLTLEIEMLIELDDSSHEQLDRIERDDFVNSAVASAHIPFTRVKVSSSYDYYELEELLYGEKPESIYAVK